MLDKAVGAAVDVAVEVAGRFGLSCEPSVLKDGANVVVHLTPYPLVARVATETARMRPGVARWLERDMAVATHLAAAGIPVTRPSVDPPAGPFDCDGFVVALWQFTPHVSAPVSPARFAASLAELHAALADLDLSDARGTYGDMATCLSLVDAPAQLWTDAARLESEMTSFPVRPLHGDAHPGNVLVTASGLVWNDFEDAWRGPLGWDLACMHESGRFDGVAAVAAYPGEIDPYEVKVCAEYRRLFGVVWRMFRAQTTPSRRADAEEHLTNWLRRG